MNDIIPLERSLCVTLELVITFTPFLVKVGIVEERRGFRGKYEGGKFGTRAYITLTSNPNPNPTSVLCLIPLLMPYLLFSDDWARAPSFD